MGICPGSMCHSARLAQRNLPEGQILVTPKMVLVWPKISNFLLSPKQTRKSTGKVETVKNE